MFEVDHFLEPGSQALTDADRGVPRDIMAFVRFAEVSGADRCINLCK